MKLYLKNVKECAKAEVQSHKTKAGIQSWAAIFLDLIFSKTAKVGNVGKMQVISVNAVITRKKFYLIGWKSICLQRVEAKILYLYKLEG